MFARRVDETYDRGRFRADEEREITEEVDGGQDRFMPAVRTTWCGRKASACVAREVPLFLTAQEKDRRQPPALPGVKRSRHVRSSRWQKPPGKAGGCLLVRL